MANKRQSVVYLEPIEHVYIHKKTKQKFKSVTTVLSMLEPEFNSEQVALAISKICDISSPNCKESNGKIFPVLKIY